MDHESENATFISFKLMFISSFEKYRIHVFRIYNKNWLFCNDFTINSQINVIWTQNNFIFENEISESLKIL